MSSHTTKALSQNTVHRSFLFLHLNKFTLSKITLCFVLLIYKYISTGGSCLHVNKIRIMSLAFICVHFTRREATAQIPQQHQKST